MTTAPAAIAPAATRLAPAALVEHLRERLEDRLTQSSVAYDQASVVVAPQAWVDAARICKLDPALGCDFFDFLSGVDRGDDGIEVVARLYSTRHRHGVILRALAPGGRERPTLPSLTGVYRGANWHERETYDMFGVDFEGHPGLLPRILTVENFEGWPLRKEFLLATREAKPWPGAKEPEERREETAEGEAPTEQTTPVPAGDGAGGAADAAPADKAAAAKAKAERAKAKAAAMRAKKAAERAAAQSATAGEARAAGEAAPGRPDERTVAAEDTAGGQTAEAAAGVAAAQAGEPEPQTPEGAAEVAADVGARASDQPATAKDAAAGAVGGDTAAGAPGDVPGVEQPVPDPQAEAGMAEGAAPAASGAPGVEAEGRHTGAREQEATKPAADTPGMTSDTQDVEPARPADHTPAPGPDSDVPGGGDVEDDDGGRGSG